MKKTALAIMVSAISAVWGSVVTNQINDGVSDWTQPASYSNNRVPQENDVVEIPDGCTVTVNSASSLAVVSRLWQLRPMGKTSTVIFDFASGEVTNNSAITYGETGSFGKIVKRGAGKVVFTAHNRMGLLLEGGTDYRDDYTYWTGSIDVESGWLIMPQMVKRHQFHYGHVTVAEGAVFEVPSIDTANPGASPSCYCIFFELAGHGTITNAAAAIMQLRPQSGDFYGKIIGKGSLYVSGCINLWGTENSFNGDVKPANNSTGRASAAGTVGVASFGTGGGKSSIGTQSYQYIDATGGGFVYLGNGETTSKSYGISAASAKGGMFIDGGQHGNLQFTGKITILESGDQYRQVLYLDGTNDVGECVLNCQICTNLYICKRGPGVWRLADFAGSGNNAFQWCDSLAVEEGTLKFDSLAEAGSLCSLGYGTRRRLPYWGTYDVTKNAPHSIALGGAPSANATLQYNGSVMATVSTRPIGVKGTGTLKGWGQPGGILGVANAWAADASGGTLVLDGEAGTTNFMANVADSNGVLNVVKRGDGFWRLSGDVDITGDIRAEGGTLEVENAPANAPYSWYRVTIRELNTYAQGSGERNLFQLQEFAFYDVNGTRHLLNPVCHIPVAEDMVASSRYRNWSSYLLLAPGECARANPGNGYYSGYPYRSLDQIFNDAAPTAGNADYSFLQEGSCNGTSLMQIRRDAPASHFKFVVRMTNGTPAIVSYDMARYRGNYPNCWTIEASADGIGWKEVAKVDDYVCPDSVDGYTQGYWMSDGKTFVKSEVRPYSSGKGFPFSASCSGGPGFVSSKVRAFGASSGATLRFTGAPVEIGGLAVNVRPGSSGVIENATYASDGTLYLDEAMPQDVTVASANLRLADVATRGNVAGWSVVVGGTPRRYHAKVGADGSLFITRAGLTVNFR